MNWSDISSVVVALSAAMGASAAWVGLFRWKKELTFKDDRELAVKVLMNAHRFREALHNIRRSAVYEHELIKGHDQLPSHERNYLNTKNLFKERWKKVNEILPVMDDAFVEARVRWGINIEEPLNKFYKLSRDLQIAQREYLLSIHPDSDEKMQATREQKAKLRQLIYELETSEDPFKQNLNAAFSELEKYLAPKLDRSFTSAR